MFDSPYVLAIVFLHLHLYVLIILFFELIGTHSEILETIDSLNKVKENQLATADRFRKLHIQNVNALYEYEIEEVNSMFKVCNSIIGDNII